MVIDYGEFVLEIYEESYREWKIEIVEMDRLRIAKVRLVSPPFHAFSFQLTNSREGDES